MAEAIGLLVIIIIVVLLLVRGEANIKDYPPPSSQKKSIRCPTCGSPADVKGSWWECGWCGDSGKLK